MFISTFFETWLVYLIGIFLLILIHVPTYYFLINRQNKHLEFAKSFGIFVFCTIINIFKANTLSVLMIVSLPIVISLTILYLQYFSIKYIGIKYLILTILLSLIFACNEIF